MVKRKPKNLTAKNLSEKTTSHKHVEKVYENAALKTFAQFKKTFELLGSSSQLKNA